MRSIDRAGRGERRATRSRVRRDIAMVMTLAFVTMPCAAGSETSPVFAVVNGESLTTRNLDSAMMEMHRGSNMAQRENFDFTQIVDKVINDCLILQEASVMGLVEEPTVVGPVNERRAQEAVKLYVRDAFTFDHTVPDDTIREYFEANYWKIGLSQLSARTKEDALQLVAALDSGAAWDSLARAYSVDSHRYRGGRHNVKHWIDVEIPIRDAVRGLSVGQRSSLFSYNGLVSLVRVDERQAVDESAFPKLEKAIRAEFEREKQQEAWDKFVSEHAERTPVLRNEEVLDDIRADSALVLTGQFRTGTSALALRVDDGHSVDERTLRLAVSRATMEDSHAGFATNLERAIEQKSRQLILGAAAEAAGFFDDPNVVASYERDLRTALIEAYLGETVVPEIVFSHREFAEYHEAHADEFREPDRVQLSMLVTEDESTAREIASRLRAGADFGFIKGQYQGPQSTVVPEEPKWTAVTVFSDAIREQLATLEVGRTSDAVDIGQSWLVFRLDGKRSGGVRPLDEVEQEIRQVMFAKKLESALESQLTLLRDRSDITIDQKILDSYLAGES